MRNRCSFTGKAQYDSYKEAKDVIEELRVKGLLTDSRGYEHTVWQCRHCNWFHVGSRLRIRRIARIPEIDIQFEEDIY